MGEKWHAVSVPEALFKRLDALAQAEGISVAFYLRKLVEKALDAPEGHSKTPPHRP